MRSYPRSVVKAGGKRIRVNNETEEYEAGLEGYESHKNPKINALQKGTDKEILRKRPVIELSEAEKLAQKNAIDAAKAELKAEAIGLAQAELDREDSEKTSEKVVEESPVTEKNKVPEQAETTTQETPTVLKQVQKRTAKRK